LLPLIVAVFIGFSLGTLLNFSNTAISASCGAA